MFAFCKGYGIYFGRPQFIYYWSWKNYWGMREME